MSTWAEKLAELQFDVEAVRQDFPILQTTVHNKPLVYLDSAATSQKPQVVIDALTNYYTSSNANVHRAVHHLASVATDAYEGARYKVAQFIGAASEKEIIFTRNATEAINLVANSYGLANLKSGDRIVVTEMEHHSNLIPWQMISKATGAELEYLPLGENGQIKLDDIETIINNKTKIVAFTLLSNVLGTSPDHKQIIARARAVNAITVIDAAQAAAHTKINVQEIDCDFITFSAHKMCGPTGVGVLYGKLSHLESIPPFLGGGEMINRVGKQESTWAEVPHKFEAGTPNIAGVVGFAAAIDYLSSIGMNKIHEYESLLASYAAEELGKQSGVIIYGPRPGETRDAVVSFNIAGVHPHDVSQTLDFEGIAIRAGHHCCQILMQTLGVPATNRASFSFYNTISEVDALVASIKKVQEFFTPKPKVAKV